MNTDIVYVGIDVSKKAWAICTFINGTESQAFKFPACEDVKVDAWGLYSMLNELHPGCRFISAHEHGYRAYVIKQALLDEGIESKIIPGNSVPKTNKELKNKTDTSDARAIARALASNQLSESVKPLEQRSLQLMVDNLKQLSDSQAKLKVRFKRTSADYGHPIPSFSIKAAELSINRLQSIPNAVQALESMLNQYKHIRTDMSSCTIRISELLLQPKYKPFLSNLITIPGISIHLASQLIAVYGDAGRFPSFGQFKSYSGLIPGQKQSGNSNHTYGQKTKTNKLGRVYHVAAMSLIKYNDYYSKLYADYRSKNKKTALTKIKIALAKEIYPLWEC